MGRFPLHVFDEWLKEDVGNYYIQLFDSTLANWVSEQPGVCTLARTCGHAGVMEFNGDVYACDHFVFPEYKLGNIHTQTLTEMMYSQRQLKFGADKHEKLPTQCKECDYLFACNGECPKNRFLHTANGEPGLNYLCKGYKKFLNTWLLIWIHEKELWLDAAAKSCNGQKRINYNRTYENQQT